jgi:hypothetical protein
MCARRRNSKPRRLRRRTLKCAREHTNPRQGGMNEQQGTEVFYSGGAKQHKWISLDVDIAWGSTTSRTNFQAIPQGVGEDRRRLRLYPAKAPVTSPIVEEVVLLFVVNDDVIYILPLRVLALECRGPRCSVFRDYRCHGHHNLAGVLQSGPGRAGIEPL